MKTSLVVLAAGMGSRFGGLKQLEPIAMDKVLLDFSIENAQKAGFDKIIFVIRRDMEQPFKQLVGDKWENKMEVCYAYQQHYVAGRTKPLGTGHAILVCEDIIAEPFAVINSDDYYGFDALRKMWEFLQRQQTGTASLVAYKLGNTLSDNGTVNRGVCSVIGDNLVEIVEQKGIAPDCTLQGQLLDKNTPVSMNLWAFFPSVFPLLRQCFEDFMHQANLAKDEFVLSTVVNELVHKEQLTVKVFSTDDIWVGMTYREDIPKVKCFLSTK